MKARIRTKIFVIAALVAWSAVVNADANAEATALFDQGIKDLKAGNVEQACHELAGSLEKLPDSGTKGALAVCYTKLGKVASAWNLWKDLADTAPTAEMKSDASDNASKLESRLPHFIIRIHGEPPAGLEITVNGVRADPSITLPLPIDPGDVVVAAAAPDHKGWSATLQATEGSALEITVPELQAVEHPRSTDAAGADLHQATLKIATQPGAEIFVDSRKVATGLYEARVRSGSHAVRVIATGMRPYNSQVVLADHEVRTIDVQMEKQSEPSSTVSRMPAWGIAVDGLVLPTDVENGFGLGIGGLVRGEWLVIPRAALTFRGGYVHHQSVSHSYASGAGGGYTSSGNEILSLVGVRIIAASVLYGSVEVGLDRVECVVNDITVTQPDNIDIDLMAEVGLGIRTGRLDIHAGLVLTEPAQNIQMSTFGGTDIPAFRFMGTVGYQILP